jgi:SAM-dependent methyltransferase
MMRDMGTQESELERIRQAYRARDSAAHGTSYAWQTPGYVFYMQQLEWEVLSALGRSGAQLVGGRVLEVGCGSGYFLQRLVDYGAATAAGIDLMADRIDQARRRHPNLELRVGNAGELPWVDQSFDVVTQFTCLSSVLDPALRQSIASEMWRVLRPSGAVLSYDIRTTPAFVRTVRRMTGQCASRAATPTRPLDVDELRALFPYGELQSRVVTLSPDLARVASRTRGLAYVAERLSFLRTHLLVTVQRAA